MARQHLQLQRALILNRIGHNCVITELEARVEKVLGYAASLQHDLLPSVSDTGAATGAITKPHEHSPATTCFGIFRGTDE